jgi:hypothetical protein
MSAQGPGPEPTTHCHDAIRKYAPTTGRHHVLSAAVSVRIPHESALNPTAVVACIWPCASSRRLRVRPLRHLPTSERSSRPLWSELHRSRCAYRQTEALSPRSQRVGSPLLTPVLCGRPSLSPALGWDASRGCGHIAHLTHPEPPPPDAYRCMVTKRRSAQSRAAELRYFHPFDQCAGTLCDAQVEPWSGCHSPMPTGG